MTIFAKYILEYNPKTGNLLSVGLAITPPTGPGHFAGARFLGGTNNTTIQPFLGYYLNLTANQKLFLQGFTALDVPVDYSDVTLVYNDLALGYFLYRDPEAADLGDRADARGPRQLAAEPPGGVQPPRPGGDGHLGEHHLGPERGGPAELAVHARRRGPDDRPPAVQRRGRRPVQLPLRRSPARPRPTPVIGG